MAKQARRAACLWTGLAVFGLSAMTASVGAAQSCPADLTALKGQIQTSGLQARLSLPMTTIIENAGGLDQAIARTTAALAVVQARRATAASEGRDTTALDDTILIFTRQIEALECRKG